MARRLKTELYRDPHPRAASSGTRATATRRRHPVILKEPVPVKARCAEVAGGTAANCVAVVCCCPIGLVNLIFLATVRLPAGLCRRALRTRAKRRKEIKRRKAAGASFLGPKAAAVGASSGGVVEATDGDGDDDEVEKEFKVRRTTVAVALGGWRSDFWTARASAADVEEMMEKEIWAKFYGTGFWRSPSQREDER